MLHDFGIDDESMLNPDLLERWNDLADIGVTLGALQMRIDQITSPTYSVINPDEVSPWENFTDNIRMVEADEDVGLEVGTTFNNRESFNEIRNTEGRTFDPIACDRRNYAFETKEHKQNFQIKDHVDYVLKSRFGKLANEVEFISSDGKIIDDRNKLQKHYMMGKR